jgi:hypothetical protein
MVLTGAVRVSETRHRRRTVILGAAGAVTLGGCGVFEKDEETPKPPDPLQPLLDEALALAAAYDRALVTEPGLATRLTPLADDHRAHAAELARVIGASPAPAPSAQNGQETIQDLRQAEQKAQKTAVAACKNAPANRAALVGSIAACRATHAEALR